MTELGLDAIAHPRVTISRQRVAELSSFLPSLGLATAPPYGWDDDRFWITNATMSARAQFFAIGCAINFRFWEQTESGDIVTLGGTKGGERHDGAMFMWRCLRLAADSPETPILDATFLAELGPSDFARIFADDHGTCPLRVAAHERQLNLNDLGRRLSASWNGSFHEVVGRSHGSLARFSLLAREFRAFDDPLQKLTMLLALLLVGAGIADFDQRPLPAIDYHIVKQLLRLGVLQPDRELTSQLAARAILETGPALQLRAAAMNALVDISRRTGISCDRLDNLLWLNRRICDDVTPVCASPFTAAKCPMLEPCLKLVHLVRPLELTRYY